MGDFYFLTQKKVFQSRFRFMLLSLLTTVDFLFYVKLNHNHILIEKLRIKAFYVEQIFANVNFKRGLQLQCHGTICD
jgi:hypothetical protein